MLFCRFRNRRVRCWLAAVLLCCLPAPAAIAGQYAVIMPGTSPLTQQFMASLATALPGDQITALTINDAIPDGTDLVITMGRHGLEARLQQNDGLPTLATYVTGESLLSVPATNNPLHTLLANPKPARQVALAKLLVPGIQRLGILLTEKTQAHLPEWRQAAAQNNTDLVSITVNPQQNLTRRLVDIITDSDILLGTDDSLIYNADNLKTILLTSYSRSKVLIGPSAPFIDAGSLTTTYSTPQDMARSTAWLIKQGAPASGSSYPRYFSVLSNAQVARSLGIPLPDDATLAQRLAELEHAQ